MAQAHNCAPGKGHKPKGGKPGPQPRKRRVRVFNKRTQRWEWTTR